MINVSDNIFVLNTKDTTYVFGILPTGQPEHLYYGRKITVADASGLREKHVFQPGNSVVYDSEHDNYTLEDVCLEMSSYGKGDIREPFVKLVYEDGSFSSDFIYDSYEIIDGKPALESLPSSYDVSDGANHLILRLKECGSGLVMELHYHVFEECNVITRYTKLINNTDAAVRIDKMMSCQIDMPDAEYDFVTFDGAWAREMQISNVPVSHSRLVNSSYTGTSSSRANPFVMLARPQTTETAGECYGFNLVYSGNHYESVQAGAYGKMRFMSGINPENFAWTLKPGEKFETPEAVMTYSYEGYNGLSGHMHDFVREHIVRGKWKNKVRPVLLNSWEACYFDINEHKLLNLARKAADMGIELFVMDDGWFGKRNDDKSSLGDWRVNKDKLPGGVDGLCRKINDMGMDFGIWVEPEMVSVDSDLYRAHPDWTMDIPGRSHSEGRNQRILDLTRKDVQDYIVEEMSMLFASANIKYVKWDMNRIVTDYFSKELPAGKQMETGHRYIIGLYSCMRILTEKFQDILFEGCAAGGNRFDLGILCYFPQIWASDNTDALCRAMIQNGYSYGYPLSVISSHVSGCPNHQTLRTTPLETRCNVASFGICGYECNLSDMKKEELDAIKAQIEIYKKWRDVLQFGRFYRTRNFADNSPVQEWTCVSPDKKRAIGFIMQKLAEPNTQFAYYRACGLLPDCRYHFCNRELKYNIKNFGDLINTVSPVHIKPDSFLHNAAAHFIKMDGEKEDVYMYGDAIMYAGVRLSPAYGGTGYNSEVRFFPDFASRIYFMESEE